MQRSPTVRLPCFVDYAECGGWHSCKLHDQKLSVFTAALQTNSYCHAALFFSYLNP